MHLVHVEHWDEKVGELSRGLGAEVVFLNKHVLQSPRLELLDVPKLSLGFAGFEVSEKQK